ncbi:sugar ABC transporter ATP-binding protein [Pseudorhodobacter sp.]|uniref:sugar ABC transporter ATP-binding protein n=1 Tax=Pseudorhodobacter sp. TaxID=1934400 RepID=UPI00264854EF|nr:sugar ABC transporter ATP-binding protein [Pseudorhodobacter sp.]MDN5786461.1 sugar ABC transporter ATP-binding protein [Pseudorhodobacter sp.]
MTTPLLSMQNISKHFGGTPALTEASLTVDAGEVHALIGQNGAGKSTLIKILTGYYTKDSGRTRYQGDDFTPASPKAAQAAGISTIYQEVNLVPMLSVTENICLGREQRRFGLLDWHAMQVEATQLLARFGIAIDMTRPVGSYSTATQQMIAIARAIGFSARLVIMDEPTSSLDERETEVLFQVIRGLKSDGVSVIFVSHRLDELYAVCDRVTIMRDGRTVKTGSMAEVDKLELVSTMLGRDVARSAGRTTGFGAPAHAAGAVVLSVQGLSNGHSVKTVSLDVRQGEIAGLAGLLGSGRTETARMIFGIDPATAGKMTIAGAAHRPRQPADAIAAGLGFCTEDRKVEGIVPDMSVADNMMLALMPALSRSGIVDEARQREIVAGFIQKLGIKCTGPGQKIRELSGGNQQKVLLARWLAMSPRLLILDEPTRGIDVGAKDEIQRLIRELADQGLAVLMISSELEEVIEGADSVFVLRDGHSVVHLTAEQRSESAVLAAMAEGDAHG